MGIFFKLELLASVLFEIIFVVLTFITLLGDSYLWIKIICLIGCIMSTGLLGYYCEKYVYHKKALMATQENEEDN